MALSVVILAAGRGKRMNSDLPKVLQPLAGKPLLQHVIDAARGLDPDNICVVYGHGGARVQAAFQEAGAGQPGAMHAGAGQANIDWVLQAQQLGTAHAVMQAMPLIPDHHTVLVLYGDVPLIKSATLKKMLPDAANGSLVVLSVDVENPAGYGRIVRDASGQVQSIVEQVDATPAQLRIREVNTGVMAAPAGALRHWLLDVKSSNDAQEFYLTDVVGIARAAGVGICTVAASGSAEVAGVNDKIQLAQAEAHHRRERAHELMLAGATLADPARIDIRGDVTVGRDVFIDVNAVLVGQVSLAAGVIVGPNCLIIDSQIGPDTEIKANSVIDHAVVGENCRIGPFARLRPQTVLHADVHIGNFVEVKAAEIGVGSKANHLTYLGDARVGSHVNVGAGSVTCNYDGANKWPTVIEDGAFIGSGSMMVAPVRIGAGATIGAGSTITEGAPDGKLSLERSRQIALDGWQRPQKLNDADRAGVIEEAMRKPRSGKKKSAS
jgi:bifunctional UDP-N-acetylglucosamine pyrophosphorylase/glucosamine-1-phosphate N-acetyltransferase